MNIKHENHLRHIHPVRHAKHPKQILQTKHIYNKICLLYTSDAADDMQCVDLGGRRIIKKIFFKQKTAYEM